jgi:hypothetical protein
LAKYKGTTVTARSWDNYNGSADGSAVIVYDDSTAGNGNLRHRITMFDDTYGVVSYDKSDNTTTAFWKSFSLSGTTPTLSSENSWTSALQGSHTTHQARAHISSTKVAHFHTQTDPADSVFKLAYIVFTLSGSTVTASSQKYLTPNGTYSFQQHGSIFDLDKANGVFVWEAQTGCAVLQWNDSTDTFTFRDQKTYATLGTNWPNVAMAFSKVDNNNWMFAGLDSAGTNFVTQGYNFNSSTNTISQNSGTSAIIVSSSGLVSTSRAYAISEYGTNGAFIFSIGDSSNNQVKLYPIKHTTNSVTVGSVTNYNSPLSDSYIRTESGWWIDASTFISISGWGAGSNNNGDSLLAFPVKYTLSSNSITVPSNGVRLDVGGTYLFQGPRAYRVDDNRIAVVYTQPGVDTTGDLMLKIIQAPT